MAPLPHLSSLLIVLFSVSVPMVLGGKAGHKKGGSLPNMWCLSWHCSKTMYRCMTDLNCRDGLFCLQDCGTDSTCTFGCIYKYTNDNYVNFLQCAVTKNHCVQLKAEQPPYKCKNTETAEQGSTENLIGTWKVVGGRHPFHDCVHGCRTMKFEGSGNKFQFTDSFVFGGKRTFKIQRSLSLNSNGNHEATYSIAGLEIKESWKIVSSAKDQVKLAYCGYLGAWEYDGALILQRQGTSDVEPETGFCTVNHNVPDHCTSSASSSQEL